MPLRTLLVGFLAGVLYPLWLLAGAGDYFSHRRTDIAHTSGTTESLLHIAQFATIAIVFVSAVLLQITKTILILMILAVLAHAVLAFIDVSFTIRRRYISPFEQLIHGFLEVIPIVAVGLIGILHWDALSESNSYGAAVQLKDPALATSHIAALLGSFAVLAGLPVLEEFLRTRRAGLVRPSTMSA